MFDARTDIDMAATFMIAEHIALCDQAGNNTLHRHKKPKIPFIGYSDPSAPRDFWANSQAARFPV
ncbi:MAG: hypothetical protein ACSLE5_10950 [Porticoccaceae bacterium]